GARHAAGAQLRRGLRAAFRSDVCRSRQGARDYARAVPVRRLRREQRDVPAGSHPPGRGGAAETARQRLARIAAAARRARKGKMNAPHPGVRRVGVAALAAYPDRIDVRSPAEFAADHISAATNHPVLDNAERARIGTLYMASPFEARKRGAALVARNIAAMLETAFAERAREWRPLVYCWRGGQRSRALTQVLNEIGWRAVQLEGGYRTYRR